jgi:serine/threonine protein kinase
MALSPRDRKLSQACEGVTTPADFRAFLDLLLETCASHLTADRGVISVKASFAEAHVGLGLDPDPQNCNGTWARVTRHVRNSGAAVISRDPWENIEHRLASSGEGMHACVPVRWDGDCIGTVYLETDVPSRHGTRWFRSKGLSELSRLAQFAATAYGRLASAPEPAPSPSDPPPSAPVSKEPPSPGIDGRLHSTTFRYQFPYPLAALYRQAHASHRPNEQFGFRLKLVEGIFRFLALVSLADAMPRQVPRKKRVKWLRALRKPGMGTWLGLAKQAHSRNQSQGGAFLEELEALLENARMDPGPDPGCEWSDVANSIVQIRNRFSHDEVQVTDEQAKPLLEELDPLLTRLLRGVSFLKRYRLGHATWCRKRKRGYEFQWYGARGLEEACQPIRLTGAHDLLEETILLIDVRTNRALYLAPYVHFATVNDTTHTRRILWIHGLRDDDSAPVRYRHPVLSLERAQGYAEPDQPEAKGLSESEYLESLAESTSTISLGLSESSLRRLEEPPMRASFGERYEIIGCLGRGGMGDVFHAYDRELGQPRAIKRMKADLAADPQAMRRFRREARILAGLDHPRVVRMFNVELGEDERPFIVMEYIEGEDLQQRLSRGVSFSAHEAVALLTQAIEALAAIHAEGLVHRDVKPANFVLSKTGLKVIDFGIVLVRDATRFTVQHDVMGTTGFMAPEQEQGEATPKSDQFGLGRLLFTLLAGRLPKQEDESLGNAAPGVPPHLAAAYAKATAREPSQRYDSLGELLAALHDEGATEETLDPGERHRRFFQGLIDELRDGHSFTEAMVATTESWHSFSSESPGVTYGLSFLPGERVRVEFNLATEDKALNQALFDDLAEQRSRIEAAIGPCSWEQLDRRDTCRVAVYQPGHISLPPRALREVRDRCVRDLLAFKRALGELCREGYLRVSAELREGRLQDRICDLTKSLSAVNANLMELRADEWHRMDALKTAQILKAQIEEAGAERSEARKALREHWLLYWRPDTVDKHSGCLDYAASGQFAKRGVQPGDVVWIVTAREGILFLVGRLSVGSVVDGERAEERLGRGDLWDAEAYALAEPGSAESLVNISLTECVEQLEFASTSSPRLTLKHGLVNAQQLQAMRQVVPAAARLLTLVYSLRPMS